MSVTDMLGGNAKLQDTTMIEQLGLK